MRLPSVLPALALILCAGQALAHNHVTVDTLSGNPGDQILIRAGYYPAETGFSIVGGRLLLAGEPAVYDMPYVLQQPGPFDAWHVGDDVLLTSDFYFATGRLDGGDFYYELAALTPVSGGPGVMAWGQFDESGVFSASAVTSAETRLLRSFPVGIGGHDHEQGYALSGGWVQDLTIIAWDAAGKFADSAPVTIRFDTGECPGDFDRQGGVTVADLFAFLDAWFTQFGGPPGSPSADFDHDGSVAVADLFGFLDSWFAMC